MTYLRVKKKKAKREKYNWGKWQIHLSRWKVQKKNGGGGGIIVNDQLFKRTIDVSDSLRFLSHVYL